MPIHYQVFTTDPEGSFAAWNAVAVGVNAPTIMFELASLVPTKRTNSGNTDKAKDSEAIATIPTVQSVWPKFRRSILGKFFRNPPANAVAAATRARAGTGSSTTTGTDGKVSVRTEQKVQDEEGWAVEEDRYARQEAEDGATEWLVEVRDAQHYSRIESTGISCCLEWIAFACSAQRSKCIPTRLAFCVLR